ncbi:hypothetical protein EZS27_038837 [termite gut metagenome]|uniref:Uncharacterized protein n=1 Tax=termite gut metagenome TaxID=433724 RepID=A0A5J4PKI9_9ZZZZ
MSNKQRKTTRFYPVVFPFQSFVTSLFRQLIFSFNLLGKIGHVFVNFCSGHLGINLCGGDVLMPQHLAQCFNGNTLRETDTGSKRMTAHVNKTQ